MKHLATAVLLLLAACSSEPPKPQPAKPAAPDQSTPEATVEAWFAAAAKADLEGMLSLFTPGGRKEEEAFARGWTKAFSSGGATLKSREKRRATTEGDTANVDFKVTIVMDGKEDGDSCRFVLARVAGTWWIVRIG